MRRLILFVLALAMAGATELLPGGNAAQSHWLAHVQTAFAQVSSILFTFDGAPATPQPFLPTNWDIQRNVSDAYRQVGTPGNGSWIRPMMAHHGADCSPPMATHMIDDVQDAVYICGNHVMTSMNAGYGAIYLTPNAQADFSTGEAVVRFDMSTFSTVGRDWVDVWVTPYEDNLALPLQDWLPPYQGEPRRAVHIRMDGSPDGPIFRAAVIRNFEATDLPGSTGKGFEAFLVPSAQRRDAFELRISRTRVRFGMPAYNNWWVDSAIPDLGWDRGVVQLGHHAYNPTKGCDETHNGEDPGGVCANTWHWDNVQISPARPFTILRATPRMVHRLTPSQITFPSPSPTNAFLRFAGAGDNLEVSFNGGTTWVPAQKQAQERDAAEHFKSYWTPMPAGVSSVLLRGRQSGAGPWMILDAAIWATAEPPPTPIPTATSTAAPTSTPTPPPGTSTPTPTTPPGAPVPPPTTTPPGPPTSACAPRPPVVVTAVRGAPGTLQVTVRAQTRSGQATNQIRQIQFGAAKNATIDAGGQSGRTGDFTVSPQAGSQAYGFTVRRAKAGDATTVPLVVTDDCGAWRTFVGGGPTAF